MAMAGSSKYPNPVQPGRTRVGWVGIGVMGGAMAGRLLAAGYPVTVFSRTPAKAEPLVAAGAAVSSSPSAVAAASDVVFTMVGHPRDVAEVVLGPGGVLDGIGAGGVMVDCTSSSPALARDIASKAKEKSCHAIDAPVSGGDAGAKNGNLAILAGGDEAVVAWLSPIFGNLGRATYMGPPGSGQSSKIANQIAVAGAVVGVTESILFARKAGLDESKLLGAIANGAAGSKVLDLFGNRILERDFNSGGFVEYMVKDLGMAVVSESESPAVLPGAALNRQLFAAMEANGDGKLGMHAVITVLERMNGMSS